MKYPIAYCLFICYTIALCKPGLPVAADALSHFFWKAKHLATVHQQLGNHHTDEEFKKAVQSDEDESGNSATKSSETIAFHISAQPILFLSNSSYVGRLFDHRQFVLYKQLPIPPFTPPKIY